MSAVTEVLASLIQAAHPKPSPLVVGDAELDARLTNSRTTQQQALRDLMDKELIPLLDTLQDPNKYRFTTGTLAGLQRDPSFFNSPTLANTLPKSTPARLDHKLGRFASPKSRTGDPVQLNIRNGAKILSDYQNSSGSSWSFPTSQAEARQQYLELIALKGFFIRTMAVIDASLMASVPVADTLALYRREGDLVVPLPQAHIRQLPAFERGYDFHFTEEVKYLIKSTMTSGLWSFPKDTFISKFKVALLAAAGGSFWENRVKAIAFLHWHLVVVGFDFLFNKFGTNETLLKNLEKYLLFCDDLRIVNGMPGDTAARVKDFEAQLNNLTLSETAGRLVVAPIDPVLLLANILGNGLLFMKAAGKPQVDGPFIQPPAELIYLAHHTSDTRHFTDPQKDKFSWIIASAAVALAKKSPRPSYVSDAMYQKIRGLGLPATLPSIPPRAKESSDAHASVATTIKNGLTVSDLDELAQFILREEAKDKEKDWQGFQPHRANIANYARALDYYKAVAAPPP